MGLKLIFSFKRTLNFLLFVFVFSVGNAAELYPTDTVGVQKVKGLVVDSKSKNPLIFASVSVNGTNISTVTNSNGEFTVKIPKKFQQHQITFSFLGYTSKVLDIKDLKEENTIKLETYIEELAEIKITVIDAKSLILEVLKRKGTNYLNELTSMTAFYRETIKKRRTYVSLSEAVVSINKQPYTSLKNDALMLYKSRKSTDYDKLDTIAFKLKGGPISTLYLDLVKNPNTFFTEDMVDVYDFSFGTPTKIDNKPIYVVNFKQKKEIEDPQYLGTLFIDAQSLTLINARFQLNLDDVEKSSRIFIVKKPRDADVTAVEASYQVDYLERNGKWHFNYSRIQLGFKINWSKKLFNTIYYTTSEMAITDWELIDNNEVIRPKDRMKPSIIMSDEASGFSDPDFWGEFNIIEPEKPIESAIKKIQKQLKKENN